MLEIVGVQFKTVGKVYYFDPQKGKFEIGDDVIVETVRGVEYGTVATANKTVTEDEISAPLRPVIRKATPEDEKRLVMNKQKEKDAFRACLEKIEKHNLNMKLIDVEYTFDRSKVLFYFTADGRVDFRELVKDLASVFKTRIELRQIGVRDEAKMLGGLGVCGRNLCCNSFLGEFVPVSIKMAKEQGLSLNPTKISGTCGRLMCCLNYEQKTYEKYMVGLPKPGAIVKTDDGRGVVENVATLKRRLTVRLDGVPAPKEYDADDVKIIKNARGKEPVAADLKELEKD